MSFSNFCYCTRGGVFHFIVYLTFAHMVLTFAEYLQLETEASYVASCSIETVKWNTSRCLYVSLKRHYNLNQYGDIGVKIDTKTHPKNCADPCRGNDYLSTAKDM